MGQRALDSAIPNVGRINEQLAELETPILAFCEESFKNIEGILGGSSTPLLPP